MASIQPIDEVQGIVWYRDIVSKTNRGNLKDGQVTLNGLHGRQAIPGQFAGEQVLGEVDAQGDGSTKKFSFTVKYAPVLKRTLTIKVDGQPTTKGIDDGEGNVIGVGITSGSIDYDNGNVVVEFNNAPDSDANITTDYESDFEGMDEIPTIQTEYKSTMVKAKSYALRSEIGLTKVA